MKVAHVSTVHFAYDPRVVFRTACTIAAHYNTTLIIQNAPKKYTQCPDLKTVSIQKYTKIWQRILLVHPVVFFKLLILNPKIIHLHDPELLPLGLFFRIFLGKIVIFDIHENIKKQLENKTYNNHIIYKKTFYFFNDLAQKYLFLIFAEAHQADHYPQKKLPHTVTLNYPDLSFYGPYINLHRKKIDHQGKINLFYIGGVSFERCIDVMINAIGILQNDYPNICLHLVGESYIPNHQQAIKTIKNYEKAKNNAIFYGKQPPDFGFELSKKCVLGLAAIKPIHDYADSYPTKIYEYMCVGLPVVASDFAHFRAIIDDNNCGFCIDPNSDVALAQAIKNVIDNEILAKKMSENGYYAAQKTYNWHTQSIKLLDFYKKIQTTQ
jgi:glycosyltransferase involved in cell wall biosynthesis